MVKPLRLAFMGTPDFSVPILDALIDAGHDVVCVYAQPPRRAGRGHKEQPTPVHARAQARGIPVRTPVSLKNPDEQHAFADLRLDAGIVAAYGLILPKAVLEAPRLGCINVHASLLPRWRGAAPLQRAIMAGDTRTGVTIMQMDEGLDTGDILCMEETPIGPDTTVAELHDRLSAIGARMIAPALEGRDTGALKGRPQPDAGACYAAKITREEMRIDWNVSASRIARQVRGLYPRAWCTFEGERIRILAAKAEDAKTGEAKTHISGVPGEVIDDALAVRCGDGVLRLIAVQRAGKSALAAADFLRGNPIAPGARFL
ncbi:methionyl-tRNA formyltransferase [Varunaivibrio sulfuroxidans]|uniref:Methionyl-tRNA formyltransferase n=1 Tax=Varunaivibrio sulfuroxidans TaxID=1773489 RepID=A0A4R3JJG8_9PROT|nr:methionyl-tRNA formyltransferase [Varunaivibrio sulfuroxidans]TCS65020.1 methionyl-tRNA formyltransferase [Varunaivibrio sulfuroxidans]WES29690.1 methionyl-tRNA formyltransferase [Varunaivibrio sulfuroxidans]